MSDTNYVGFWARVGASLIDTVIYMALFFPLLWLIYGKQYFTGELPFGTADVISILLPVIVTIAFWMKKRGTPGKLLVSAHVVDAETGANLKLSQSIIRYIGYFVSTIPFCLGFLWVAFDKRKQGWHDKIAGTVVVKKPYS
jgi:uncharacterized RDD family membrane protein YckC